MFRYTHVEHHQPSAETLVMCVTGADHHHHRRCCLCSTWRSFPSETPFESDFFPRQCRCLYSAHFCYVHVVRRGNQAKSVWRQSHRCVLCIPKSHSERCQSPYTSCICGSFVCWQEEQRDKTARRLASISPPQALCLTLYTSLDALNSSP